MQSVEKTYFVSMLIAKYEYIREYAVFVEKMNQMLAKKKLFLKKKAA